jgi:hypothetical protein
MDEFSFNWMAYDDGKKFGLGLLYDSGLGSEGLGTDGRVFVSDLALLHFLRHPTLFPFQFLGNELII